MRRKVELDEKVKEAAKREEGLVEARWKAAHIDESFLCAVCGTCFTVFEPF
jgi:hypothetical protein